MVQLKAAASQAGQGLYASRQHTTQAYSLTGVTAIGENAQTDNFSDWFDLHSTSNLWLQPEEEGLIELGTKGWVEGSVAAGREEINHWIGSSSRSIQQINQSLDLSTFAWI